MLLLICNIIAWFFDNLVVTPVWWLASYLATFLYPYEDSKEHWALALGICIAIIGGLIGLAVILL